MTAKVMFVVGCIATIVCGMFSGAHLSWHRIFPRSSVRDEERSCVISGCVGCCLKGFVFSVASHRLLMSGNMDGALELCSAFELFEVADLVYTHMHGLASWDMTLHHFMHLLIGVPLTISQNEHLLYVGTRLLTQETSTVFLDLFLLSRHRHTLLGNVFFVFFFITFYAYRVIGTGLLCYELWPEYTFAIIFPSYVLQLWWFRLILLKLLRRLHFLQTP